MKVLFFSDIHSDWRALERLVSVEADYYVCAGDLVSWARGLNRGGEILKQRAGQVFVIPGNHERDRDVAEFCESYGFTDLHGRSVQLGSAHLAALGYSNVTPFDTPGEFSEDELSSRLEAFAGLRRLVLVCHCPPYNTKLDAGRGGRHFGSAAIGRFIDRVLPRYFFCGHIHEAEGVETRLGPGGETIGVNVGKKGYLLDWDLV
ncbi:MAG: metallophosphoesterase [Bryobacter sp.]|jgi:Icc-related predicted phosphoesterase|nr:metallophosphoesterase [Bryobacter sp. CoA8 C33]